GGQAGRAPARRQRHAHHDASASAALHSALRAGDPAGAAYSAGAGRCGVRVDRGTDHQGAPVATGRAPRCLARFIIGSRVEMMNALLDELEAELGAQGLLRQDISARHSQDWSAEPGLAPGAVLRPASAQEVAAALRLCNAYGQPLVIQGGLTGLSGGAVPRAGELALSLERLSGVEEIDAASMTMTVKAGTPLQAVQQAAEAAGFVFPLDLGA